MEYGSSKNAAEHFLRPRRLFHFLYCSFSLFVCLNQPFQWASHLPAAKLIRKESKLVQTKKRYFAFHYRPFVWINFDFSWLNNSRLFFTCLWGFNLLCFASKSFLFVVFALPDMHLSCFFAPQISSLFEAFFLYLLPVF